MTITFYTFERIWCWVVGHDWCNCIWCGPLSDQRCRRCKLKVPFVDSYRGPHTE